jgi:hypothetical protein
MKLNSRKLRLVLIGSLGLAVVIFIATFVVGLSVLGAKSKTMVGLEVKSQTAETQLSNLQQAKKQVEEFSYFKEVAKSVIPNDKDQAEAVVEINDMANKSGLAIQSIVFPASTLGLPSATATTDATASGSAGKAISQAKPVSDIPGLYSLELIVTPDSSLDSPATQITYAKMLNFLSRIENNRHTSQISEVNITPPGAGPTLNSGLTFALTINIFIKP